MNAANEFPAMSINIFHSQVLNKSLNVCGLFLFLFYSLCFFTNHEKKFLRFYEKFIQEKKTTQKQEKLQFLLTIFASPPCAYSAVVKWVGIETKNIKAAVAWKTSISLYLFSMVQSESWNIVCKI